MKKRPIGFLAEDKIDHDGEVFDYIKELHNYLWEFVRAINPNPSSNLDDNVDKTLKIVKEIKGFIGNPPMVQDAERLLKYLNSLS